MNYAVDFAEPRSRLRNDCFYRFAAREVGLEYQHFSARFFKRLHFSHAARIVAEQNQARVRGFRKVACEGEVYVAQAGQ